MTGAGEGRGAGTTGAAAVAPPAKAVLPPPRLADVRPEDLRDAARVLELHRQAVARGLVGSSEGDRLKFAAAAEHAGAVGTVNPGGLFARLVARGWWHFATQGEEDAAARRLKRHLHGEPAGRVVGAVAGPRPPSPAGAALSTDAALVRAVRAAVERAGGRSDPFPLVRARDPSWTRERWDRAAAELARSSEAAIRVPAGGLLGPADGTWAGGRGGWPSGVSSQAVPLLLTSDRLISRFPPCP